MSICCWHGCQRQLSTMISTLRYSWTIQRLVVAGLRSPWARRRNVNLAELMGEAWVFPKGQVVRGIIAKRLARARSLDAGRACRDQYAAVYGTTSSRPGAFTILAGSVLRYNAEQWSFKALPVDLRIKSRPHAIVTLKNRTLSPYCRTLHSRVESGGSSTVSHPRRALTRS